MAVVDKLNKLSLEQLFVIIPGQVVQKIPVEKGTETMDRTYELTVQKLAPNSYEISYMFTADEPCLKITRAKDPKTAMVEMMIWLIEIKLLKIKFE